MSHCPQCAAAVSPGSRFCSQCGSPLHQACPHCGFALAANARFCGGCGQPAAASASPPVPAVPAGERRQLTVMFCDLVDSTALSTRLDPEDHREVLRAYQAACAKCVGHYEGYIAQFLGDGIMAYFGYPKAHEDAPERAVLAGLEIVEAIAKLAPLGVAVRTRVGIATGLVVVGDKIAKGDDFEVGVVGETPNLAARVQGLARPGEVAIGPSTRRLLGGQFEYEDLGEHRLKGFGEPVQAFRVLSAVASGSRFKALRSFNVKMVDRRREQALLKNLGAKAAREGCQAVLIQGEAGIGKSRLAHALAEWMAESGDACLVEMQCSAHHTQSTLFPAANALRQMAFRERRRHDFGPPDGVERRRHSADAWDALARFLGETLGEEDAAEALPLLANLLSIPAPPGFPASPLPPQQQRQLILKHLLNLVMGLGQGRPVLLLMEDLHWADPSTLEFVEHLIERGGLRKLLALFTSRPEFAPSWAGKSRLTLIQLGRLPEEDAAELVGHALGGMPREAVEAVVAKTDGVPLYLLEYAKAFAESGAQAARSAIPSSLQDLLLARLDRLGEAKAVAQAAALLGREFDGRLLAAVWTGGAQALKAGLERLLAEEFIQPRGEPGRQGFAFRHALVQDAAYESMLKSSRAALHLRIAEAVELGFPEIVDSQPEWLAQHFASGGRPEQAIAQWRQAGLRAGKLAAYAEACRHFEAALAQLGLLPETPERHGRELDLRIQLAMAVQAARGYAVAELGAVYGRARELCGLLGDTADLYPVLRGLVSFYIAGYDMGNALDVSEQCARLGRETGRPEYQIEAYNSLAYTYAYTGRLREGEALALEGERLYLASGGEALEFPSPHDPLMGCQALLFKLYWLFGEARKALHYEQALKLTLERLASPFNDAYGHVFLAFVEQIRGHFGLAAHYAAVNVDVSRRHQMLYMLDVGNANLASAQARDGQFDAIEMLKATIAAKNAKGALLHQEYFYAELAEACRAAGEPWLALAAADDGLALCRKRGELMFLAELRRLRGELLAGQGEAAQGEAELRGAAAVARRHGAVLFELRAALALWRLGLGAAGEARGLAAAAAARIDPEDGALIAEWREAQRLLGPGG